MLYHLSLGKGTTIAFASGRLLGDLLQQEATRSAAAKLFVLASNQDRWRVFFFFVVPFGAGDQVPKKLGKCMRIRHPELP